MTESSQGAARRTLAASDQIRDGFETAIGDSIDQTCAKIDVALAELLAIDATLTKRPDPIRTQTARALMLLSKSLYDIVGALELVRRGYEGLALGVMRAALECWATALLVRYDEKLGGQFSEGRYSTNDSIQKLLGHKSIKLDKEDKEAIRTTYKALHLFAHPSAIGLTRMIVADGFVLGGRFDPALVDEYRQIVEGCGRMAQSVAASTQRL